MAIVKSCLACGRNNDEVRSAKASKQNAGSFLRDEQALKIAVEIGDFILNNAITLKRQRAWIGLTYDPFHDLEQLSLLNDDILSGVCGIAIFLADLFLASDIRRFGQACLEILHQIASRRTEAEEELSSIPAAHSLSGFLGPGCQIYTVQRCASALANSIFDKKARSIAISNSSRSSSRLVQGAISGNPGLLLALTDHLNNGRSPSLKILREFKSVVESLSEKSGRGTISGKRQSTLFLAEFSGCHSTRPYTHGGTCNTETLGQKIGHRFPSRLLWSSRRISRFPLR